ncbi:MAG: hypothetical protein ACON5F_05505 [Jejuia sp.]
MCGPKVQAILIGVCYTLFVYFLFSGNTFLTYCFGALILPIITVFYFCSVQQRSIYFVLFLVIYSLSDLISIFAENLPIRTGYYICNTLYILAYIALSVEIARSLDFQKILKHYKFSIIVLLLLNAYIAYQLLQIVNPDILFGSIYITEITYNIVMLLILSFALLNYFNKDSRKAFYILVGTLCIVFAEVLNVAYLYVSKQNLLSLLTISLGLIGFYFLYAQAKLNYKKTDKALS